MSDDDQGDGNNRCRRCGACCGVFKIAFPNFEVDLAKGGMVPIDLTEADGLSKRTMKTALKDHKQCIALQGKIGLRVSCMIYDRRPSSCRDFKAAWEENTTNDQCNRARAIYGLTTFDCI